MRFVRNHRRRCWTRRRYRRRRCRSRWSRRSGVRWCCCRRRNERTSRSGRGHYSRRSHGWPARHRSGRCRRFYDRCRWPGLDRRWCYRAGRLGGCRRMLLADDGLEHITGLGNMGKIDLGLDFVGFGPAGTRTLSLRRRFALGAEIGSYLDCFVFFKRTGMGFLFCQPHFRK